jgi:hypothetical protein
VSMSVGVMFGGEGRQQQQPCILALPWFLPVAPSVTIPLPPFCTAAFASLDGSNSDSHHGPIIGSHVTNAPLEPASNASVTVAFDADVDVGE